ncbi:MAG TPA: hypothetical protein VML95_09500 [Longimicrobiales bacterium]|nr:hypothetical protein [Longimicrobiales bacterium]
MQRADHLASVWAAAGLHPPGKNEDETDAVWLGYSALTTGELRKHELTQAAFL